MGVVVGAILFAVFSQKGSEVVVPDLGHVSTTTIKAEPLSNIEEPRFQYQMQDILQRGKEVDCVNIANEIYRSTCQRYFKGSQNKGTQLIPIESKITSLQDLLEGIPYVTSTKNIVITKVGIRGVQSIDK